MIKVENIDTFNFEGAIRGMRNPLNSWDKSDSYWVGHDDERQFMIGENDLDLMRRLYKAGSEHRKYLRQIFVSMDITAPLYWWKEFDTYKVGTVSNSCSTMHTIHKKEFELDDFSIEHLTEGNVEGFKSVLNCLNTARQNYIETKDKKWWWQMIQVLPASYNQKRTITMDYETLLNIYETRKNHKLDEWNKFREWILTLPYTKELFENDH